MKKVLYTLAAIILLPIFAFQIARSLGVIQAPDLSLILNVALGISGPSLDEQTDSEDYNLPPGFNMQVFSADIERARFLRFTRNGDLLVSRPHSGDIVLLQADRDGDGKTDGRNTVIEGLNRPQGMDFHGDWLYIAERDQVGRIEFDHNDGSTRGDYQPIITGLTGNGNHWSKTLRFGLDGLLYLAQGSTCNVCVEEDQRRATMMRFQADGSDGEIISTGLRNSVGFDWAPWDNGLYATDNGRDMLGDDFPPCELNLVEEGGFYGWPYYNGDNIPDPDMGADPQLEQRSPTSPAHNFRAHNAPLGISFVDSSTWPGDFEKVALVALHGSWNRSTPDGYRVVSLHFTDQGIEERDFFSGFNRDGEIVGRPVDVAQGPNGDIYISDDYAGAIYRISPNLNGDPSDSLTENRIANETLTNPQTENRLDASPPEWLAAVDLSTMREQGKALYQQHNCGSCHDEQLAESVSLDALNERLGYNAVIETLRAPRAPMPAIAFSDEQMRALAVHLLDKN